MIAVSFFSDIPLHAETLDDAIIRACRNSPRIRGEGFGQQANVENVAISRAGGLPTATINGDLSNNLISAAGSPVDRSSGSSPSRNLSANPQFGIPVYLGGAIGNQVEAARSRVASGREVLRDVEADTILRVVTAYMDVLRDGAIVESRRNNVRALEVNLKATESRFEVGDLTRTDVAQSQARLAQARTQLTTAEAQVTSSRERYREEVGVPSSDLVAPPMLVSLPRSADEASVAALEGNPVLVAARLERGARRSDVLAANAVRLPTVNVVGNVGFNNYLGSYSPGANPLLGDPGQTRFGVTGGLEVGLPVFQGGRPGALSRQASAREGQSIEQVTSVERDVITQVRTAFASWQAAVGTTIANKAAIDANRVSLEGVRAENTVGTRTVLDVLNAEQELTNSNVALISAERDAYVAAYNLVISEGLKGKAGVMPITNCDAFR